MKSKSQVVTENSERLYFLAAHLLMLGVNWSIMYKLQSAISHPQGEVCLDAFCLNNHNYLPIQHWQLINQSLPIYTWHLLTFSQKTDLECSRCKQSQPKSNGQMKPQPFCEETSHLRLRKRHADWSVNHTKRAGDRIRHLWRMNQMKWFKMKCKAPELAHYSMTNYINVCLQYWPYFFRVININCSCFYLYPTPKQLKLAKQTLHENGWEIFLLEQIQHIKPVYPL